MAFRDTVGVLMPGRGPWGAWAGESRAAQLQGRSETGFGALNGTVDGAVVWRSGVARVLGTKGLRYSCSSYW